jgi:hypothetical protein
LLDGLTFSEKARECGLDFGLAELVHQLMQPLAPGHAPQCTRLGRLYEDLDLFTFDSTSRATRPFSVRLDERVATRLEQRARRPGENKSRLAERYIDEGMRMDDHPGIVFRDGPAGRRAGLAAGPDVWEVMTVVRNAPKRGDAAVAHAASWLELTPEQVRVAVRYYSDHPDEIEERIRRHQEEADAEEAAWRREQAALA